MKIILIAGQAGVGKTTLAHILAKKVFELGYVPQLMSFAGPLKEKAKELGFGKETEPEKYREYCQQEGQARRDENPDHWVSLFENDLGAVLEDENKDLESDKTYWERCVIVDDCRYTNELALGIKHSGILIFLSYGNRDVPDSYGEWREHHSENLAKLVDEGPSKHRSLFDAVLKNQGTVEDLKEKVEPMLEGWLSQEEEIFDEHVDDLSKAVEELVNLLLLGKVEVEIEEIDDEDEDWDDSDNEYFEGAD